ncbi:MFS transporter [Novosphingobium sp.]|uniref:MFS transporter n=1 Tax=Novosphingobium sp. TaxID=1874826 RepID=UPI0025E9D546|nr:MFS transporter [Novosphingobium sp.]
MNGSTAAASTPAQVAKAGRIRWTIVALLFVATTINYIDRTMLGLLKPDLAKEMRWSEDDYGTIVTAFQAAYAIGFLVFGRIIDRFGPKIGYAMAIIAWTIGHVAHGFASSVTSFMAARIVLGVGEAGHFPSVVRVCSEWFPQKERSYAIGWINSATTVGVILTAPVLAVLMTMMGLDWRGAFLVSGLFGVALLAAWLFKYANPRQDIRVSRAELAWIEHDPADPVRPVSWLTLAGKRETWAFALGKFLTDPVWFLMLFWLPSYFSQTYQVDLKIFLWPMIAMYLLSDIGSIGGGWLSSRLIQNGRTPNFARKITMIVAALCVLPILTVTRLDNLWLSVVIIGIALAGHQAFSANLFSIPADTFPKHAVGSVIGLGGFMGGIGGMIMAKSTGLVLDATDGDYTAIFAACTVVYFAAIGFIHLFSPRLARADV